MSNPHLPAEILDHIIEDLHDAKDALWNCCLVSKSWIPRTRKHLFADIKFTAKKLQSWQENFPDPSTSPARYTKTLLISCPQLVTAADSEAGGWVTGFSRVARLEVRADGSFVNPVSFVPFHGFSPLIKSLSVTLFTLSSPHIFDLILSFPLLEDLAVKTISDALTDIDGSGWLLAAARSSSTPMFTGSLNLLWAEMKPVTRWLLALPGGIHFRKLIGRWSHEEDIPLMMALVERCSHNLESLVITYGPGKSIRHLRPHKITHYCF